MSRWTLTDPVTSDTWTMPINPDAMTSPHRGRELTHARGNKSGLQRARSFMRPPQPVEWQWEGVIRSQEHYDELLLWASKSYPIHVTDHLNRTWLVVIRKFAPTERRPTATVPVRMRYAMETLNLGEVTP